MIGAKGKRTEGFLHIKSDQLKTKSTNNKTCLVATLNYFSIEAVLKLFKPLLWWVISCLIC